MPKKNFLALPKTWAIASLVMLLTSCTAQKSDTLLGNTQSKTTLEKTDTPLTKIVMRHGSDKPVSHVHFHDLNFGKRAMAIKVSETFGEGNAQRMKLLELKIDDKNMQGSNTFSDIDAVFKRIWNGDLSNFKCTYESDTECDLRFSIEANVIDPKLGEDDDIRCTITIAQDNSVSDRCIGPNDGRDD